MGLVERPARRVGKADGERRQARRPWLVGWASARKPNSVSIPTVLRMAVLASVQASISDTAASMNCVGAPCACRTASQSECRDAVPRGRCDVVPGRIPVDRNQ